MANVKGDLIHRDTCCLRPGIGGLSENIRRTSIVGRFMEHLGIYCFRNFGQDAYFIGSADIKKRNLEARVGILIPVEVPELKQELRTIFDLHNSDQPSARNMRPDGA